MAFSSSQWTYLDWGEFSDQWGTLYKCQAKHLAMHFSSLHSSAHTNTVKKKARYKKNKKRVME